MQISRRDALMGATAAVITGAAAAPLAIKATLAGASDARIFALVEEHGRTFAEMDAAGDRWFNAVIEKMPVHLRGVDLLDRKEALQKEAFHAAMEACDYPEVKVLRDKEDRLRERCHDLKRQLSQTEAMTLQGVCAKFRIAKPLRYRTDDDLGDSAVADVERLAGEARS